ncbi:hypothetical protein [Streptomyces sp. 147326]|uniref:hypothetical protein n=1 Tax=Streptomyces sp. 147326 TaxID=3074379 RepID=UPI0038579F33
MIASTTSTSVSPCSRHAMTARGGRSYDFSTVPAGPLHRTVVSPGIHVITAWVRVRLTIQ